MKTPQPQAVLAPITEAAIFLVIELDDGAESEAKALLTDVGSLTRSVGFRLPEGNLTCVVGIGALAWDRLFGPAKPAGLHPLEAVAGPKHGAVSTPGDLLFHIRAHRFDLCFELAQHVAERMAGHGRVVDEVHGFRSFDLRDVLGFVDGTENPTGPAAKDAVEVGAEDPSFVGGSYVVVQKYVHDLRAWNALTVEEQEAVIGRTKLSDIEMTDDVKPSNSHVALNTIVEDDGTQHQILRYNMPFGRVGAEEYGTYFIGYARTPVVIEQMLRNMFVGRPADNYDRVLDFSTAVTGSLFFAPTADLLEGSIAPAPASIRAASQRGTGQRAGDDSLGIGSLR